MHWTSTQSSRKPLLCGFNASSLGRAAPPQSSPAASAAPASPEGNAAPTADEAEVTALASEFDALNKAHPDWQTAVDTPEFQVWLQRQPPVVQAAMNSNRATDAIWLLGSFKRDVAEAKARIEAAQRTTNQSRLAAHTGVRGTPRGSRHHLTTSKRPSTSTPSSDLLKKVGPKERTLTMTVNTYGSISQRTAAWASKDMLSHAMPIEVLARYAMSKPIPKNTAEGAKFRRPIPFPSGQHPLTEGVTPAGRAMQYEDVPVTLYQYGDFVEITDKVMDMAEDPVLKDANMLCGEQAAETIENLLWGVLTGGTVVGYVSGTGTSRATLVADNRLSTASTGLNALRTAVRALKSQRAKMVTEMLAGSPNYATEPVGAAFFGSGTPTSRPTCGRSPASFRSSSTASR